MDGVNKEVDGVPGFPGTQRNEVVQVLHLKTGASSVVQISKPTPGICFEISFCHSILGHLQIQVLGFVLEFEV